MYAEDIYRYLPTDQIYGLMETTGDISLIEVYKYPNWDLAAKHLANHCIDREYDLSQRIEQNHRIEDKNDSIQWRFTQPIPNYSDFRQKVYELIDQNETGEPDTVDEVTELTIEELLALIPTEADQYLYHEYYSEGIEGFFLGSFSDISSQILGICGSRGPDISCHLVENRITGLCGIGTFKSESMAHDVYNKIIKEDRFIPLLKRYEESKVMPTSVRQIHSI